jgi:hypothetical protein
MNPWIIDSVITVTKEAAKRNGFRLEPAGDNRIALMADKHPYAKDICITRFNTWEQAEVWFGGYEQHMMEANVIAGLRKSNKSKEKNT